MPNPTKTQKRYSSVTVPHICSKIAANNKSIYQKDLKMIHETCIQTI